MTCFVEMPCESGTDLAQRLVGRRAFLVGSLAIPGIAIAGCTMTTSQLFTAAAADATTISSALAAFAPLSTLVPGLVPLVDAATALAPAIASLATQLAAATSTSTAQPLANQILADVNAVEAAAVGVPGLPAQLAQALADIQTVTLSIVANVSGAAGASPQVDAARMRLKAFAAGGRH